MHLLNAAVVVTVTRRSSLKGKGRKTLSAQREARPDVLVTREGAERLRGQTASSGRPAARNGAYSPWAVASVGGLVLAVIGWIDVLTLWYPLRFGNTEWEFATISGMFDSLPLGTIGVLALSAAALAGGRAWLRWVLGVAAAGIAITLAGLFLLFALSWLEGWGLVEPEMRWVLGRAGIKASVFAIGYVALYAWLAATLVRSMKKGNV